VANKVTVKVGSEFNKKGIEQAKQGLGELDGKTKSTGTSMAASMAMATAAAAAVVFAVTKAVQAAKDLVDAYAEQELVEKRLEIAVRNNPLLSGEAAGSLVEYAAALQKVSTFGDEAIIQQAQFLASMSLTEQQIRDVLDVAVDFASTGVVSLDSAVRNIAKTFGGLTGELGELIPELKDLTTEELEQGGAVDILREKYAGMAEEMASTTAGEMQQFENAWGDLKEVAGSFLADVLTPIVDTLTAMVSAVNEAVTALRNMRNEFAQFEGQQPDIKLVDLRLSTPEDISQALESAMGTGSPFDDFQTDGGDSGTSCGGWRKHERA